MISSSAFDWTFNAQTKTLSLHGEINILTYGLLLKCLSEAHQAFYLDLTHVTQFDVSGAHAVHIYLSRHKTTTLLPLPSHIAPTWALYQKLPYTRLPSFFKIPLWKRALQSVGERFISCFQSFFSYVQMLGLFMCHTATVLKMTPQEYLRLLCQQSFVTAVRAMPIIGIMAFMVGVVLCYEGVVQLAKFGAESSIVTLISYSMLREAGALITAIVVAGRSGSAFTAEIGAMKIGEELDALTIMGINPIDVLIVPRIWALILMLPLLTIMADFMGLLGGALVCSLEIKMSLSYFFRQVQHVTSLPTFWIGIVKAPFFGLAIGLIACHQGLRVGLSASSIGNSTTVSVVKSLLYVVMLNSIFSVLFSYFRVG